MSITASSSPLRVPRIALAFVGVLVACESYEPEPIDGDLWLERIAAEREAAVERDALTLVEAGAMLLERNPRVVAARNDHAVRAAVAEQGVPLTNPSVSAGPLWFDGPGITSATRWGIEAALGWALPFPGVRASFEQQQVVEAEAAYAHFLAAGREEYLALRGEFADLILAGARVGVREELVGALRQSVAEVEQRVVAGRGDALDVLLLRLAAREAEFELSTTRESLIERRARVAQRCGASLAAIGLPPAATQPSWPDTVPTLAELDEKLSGTPELLGLRADYEVAERRLRAAIARQYPDLSIGPTWEQDEDDIDRIGLGIGITLPLFDRNQAAIARAYAERSGVRDRYVAALRSSRAELERAREVLTARTERLTQVREQLEPLIEQLRETARAMVEVGAVDGLRLLEIARTTFTARLDVLDAEALVIDAWSAMERASGVPWMWWPDEPEERRK